MIAAMDSDDEMMVQLFTEEQNAEDVRRQQHPLILTSMLRVRRPFFVVPRCGRLKAKQHEEHQPASSSRHNAA
jgi:hypothetical protein